MSYKRNHQFDFDYVASSAKRYIKANEESAPDPTAYKRTYSAKKKVYPSSYKKKGTSAGYKYMMDRIKRLEVAAIRERPPKRILYSDQGVVGGNYFGTTAGTLATGIDCNNTTPFKKYINNLSRGTTVQSRLADYCYFSKCHLTVRTIFDTSVVGTQQLNWMLFVDLEVKGASQTAAQFASEFFGTSTPYTNAIKNTNNSDVDKKYRVLQRGMIKVQQQVAGQTEQVDWTINWYSKKHVRTAYVLGNAGTVADIDTGAIQLFMWTDNTVGTIKSYFEGNLFYRDQV